VFLVVDENHNYNQIIGNPAAPEILGFTFQE
jgi:hypothetical protein